MVDKLKKKAYNPFTNVGSFILVEPASRWGSFNNWGREVLVHDGNNKYITENNELKTRVSEDAEEQIEKRSTTDEELFTLDKYVVSF